MKTLFVSYSSKDKQFAEKLAVDLRRSGVKVWLDRWEIKVGDSIVDKINEGISENDFLAIVFTPSSVESPWVKKEMNSSLRRQLVEKNVKILPILYKDCHIPDIIGDICYADFRKNYFSGLQQLLDSIHPLILSPKIKLTIDEKLDDIINDIAKNPWDYERNKIEPIIKNLKKLKRSEPIKVSDGLINLVKWEYGNISYFTLYQGSAYIFEELARKYIFLRENISPKLIEMIHYPLFLPWSEILHSEKSTVISAMMVACGEEVIPEIELELIKNGTADPFYIEELVYCLSKFGVAAKQCVPQLKRIHTSIGGDPAPGIREAIARVLGDIADDNETITFLEKAAEVELKLIEDFPKQKEWIEEFDINVPYAIENAILSIKNRMYFS